MENLEKRPAPVTPYLEDLHFDPETKLVLTRALEMTRVALGLRDRYANEIIAKRITELAKAGEHNPDRRLRCLGPPRLGLGRRGNAIGGQMQCGGVFLLKCARERLG